MKISRDLEYKREKIERDDGSFFNLLEVKSAASSRAAFERVNSDNIEKKLFDTGYLRLLKAKERGIAKPAVIIWAGYPHCSFPTEFFENISKDENELYLSLNAYINENLRYLIKNKNYKIKDQEIFIKKVKNKKDKEAEEVLNFLKEENRIKFFQFAEEMTLQEIHNNLNVVHDLTAVGEIAYPSDYCRKNKYHLGFNASFFLLEFTDWESRYSLLGDPYNLQISDGEIIRPPIYRRSALLESEDGSWVIKKLFLRDLLLTFQSQHFDLSKFKVNRPGEKNLYTRYYGVEEEGFSQSRTPKVDNKIELIIIDRSVVGIRKAGESEIPQNGFVLSISENLLEIKNLTDLEVDYQFKNGAKYLSGIQNGPALIEAGELVLDNNTLKNEEFFGEYLKKSELKFGKVVPTDYAQDIDQTRAARIAAGVDKDGRFSLLAVESANSGMSLEDDSSGATLKEMAELALERNYKYALNLDGGGSTNIQYHYGSLLKTADRRGLPGVVYERMVPVLGVLKNNND
jgi:hypothetical protein